MAKKKAHGGARPGAGRKGMPGGSTTITAVLDRETMETLGTLEKGWSETRSGTVRRCIREAGERHGVKGKK